MRGLIHFRHQRRTCPALFFLLHLMDLLADNRLCHKTTYHGPSVAVSHDVRCIVQAEKHSVKDVNESFEIIFMIR